MAARSGSSPILDLLARWPLATLFLLCFIAWVPGFFTLPPLDRDESRFAQASKQMIETGNYVDIRYSVGPRYKKPVGIYWMQAASTKLFSKPPYNEIWTYRLPSLIGGFIAVFLGTVLGSQALLLRFYLAARLSQVPPNLWVALGGWLAFAIGVLIKGPIIIAVLTVTIVAISLWDRDWKWLSTLHWLPGLVLTGLVVLPWGIAIAFASHGEFYEQSLGHDFVAKILGGQESHGAPPGYYLLLASVTLWPATLFALPGIGSAIARRN